MYDYLIVGAGLFGAVFANEATKRGKKCLVIDRRSHIGGNCYTENKYGINVHKYGAHIFRTSDKDIWNYVNKFAEFNNFINTPIAITQKGAFNLPFNMNTFARLWNISTPEEAKKIISDQKSKIVESPKNLEEKAISLVGVDVYELFIKGYTEKQWGRKCKDLPASIIRRIPVRFTYNNNYFNDRYQGVPIGGYTKFISNMLKGVDILLNTDFLENRPALLNKARRILFTGAIDEYFSFSLGKLQYRSLEFVEKTFLTDNLQGVAVCNYPDLSVPYTRSIEHKHFEPDNNSSETIISYEYSVEWKEGLEPYYPINDKSNEDMYKEYQKLAENEQNVIFGGRLGEYKYYDMQDTIKSALKLARIELGE